MYKNDILNTLTGNQPDLEKLIKEQANEESFERVPFRPVPDKRKPDSRSVQYTKRYNNSVKRHK